MRRGIVIPNISIAPGPANIVYAGPVRSIAIGAYIDRIARMSASAPRISACPAASSGRRSWAAAIDSEGERGAAGGVHDASSGIVISGG